MLGPGATRYRTRCVVWRELGAAEARLRVLLLPVTSGWLLAVPDLMLRYSVIGGLLLRRPVVVALRAGLLCWRREVRLRGGVAATLLLGMAETGRRLAIPSWCCGAGGKWVESVGLLALEVLGLRGAGDACDQIAGELADELILRARDGVVPAARIGEPAVNCRDFCALGLVVVVALQIGVLVGGRQELVECCGELAFGMSLLGDPVLALCCGDRMITRAGEALGSVWIDAVAGSVEQGSGYVVASLQVDAEVIPALLDVLETLGDLVIEEDSRTDGADEDK